MAETGCLKDAHFQNLQVDGVLSHSIKSPPWAWSTPNQFYDDFFNITMGTTEVKADALFSDKGWAATGTDTGGSISLATDQRGGVAIITNHAGGNNQTQLFAHKSFTMFAATAQQDITFKARFRTTSTANQHQSFFIGLTSNHAADFIADDTMITTVGTAQSTYGLMRAGPSGELVYRAYGQNDTTCRGDTGSGDALTDSVDATIHRWYVFTMTLTTAGGATSTHFAANYTLYDETAATPHTFTSATASPDLAFANQLCMGPAIIIKNGGSEAQVHEIDYIYCSQPR